MSVLLSASAFADDFGGADEVREDGVVDGRKGPGARALLGFAGPARREREDAALSDEQDVAVGKLLLELARQSIPSCQQK